MQPYEPQAHPAPRSWFLILFSRLPGEMAGARVGARQVEDEPGASHNIREEGRAQKKPKDGIPWQSSGQDSELPLQRAWV